MSLQVVRELAEAETLLSQVIAFHQYGAPAGTSPKNVRDLLDTAIEHFLRRDEPESAYFGRFVDKENPDQLDMLKGQPAEGQFHFQQPAGIRTFPDGCVCGEWSEAPNEVHLISAPCYYITED